MPLSRFRASKSMKRWIDPILAARSVMDSDVAAGHHVQLLRLLVAMENRVVRVARGEYEFEGDTRKAEHKSNSVHHWGAPNLREGHGSLQIAAGFTLVGQDGVVLANNLPRVEVQTEGVSFESMHFPLGVEIGRAHPPSGGSATMTKCTSTWKADRRGGRRQPGHGGQPRLP